MSEKKDVPAVLYVLVIVLVLMFSFGCWLLARRIHYNLAYKSMVQETIREMVKPDALTGRER